MAIEKIPEATKKAKLTAQEKWQLKERESERRYLELSYGKDLINNLSNEQVRRVYWANRNQFLDKKVMLSKEQIIELTQKPVKHESLLSAGQLSEGACIAVGSNGKEYKASCGYVDGKLGKNEMVFFAIPFDMKILGYKQDKKEKENITKINGQMSIFDMSTTSKNKPTAAKPVKAKSKPTVKQKPEKAKDKPASAKKPARNPFMGVDDVYLTKNKIAVTTVQTLPSKRGYTVREKRKYYVKSSDNLKRLKEAQGPTARMGRKGNTYVKI